MQEVPEELEALCRREYPRLVGLLVLYCRDHGVAEDLAQETLARVCRDWPRLEKSSRSGAWAYRVAINLANSRFRRLAAERRAKSKLEPVGRYSQDEDLASSIAVRQALQRLPPRRRAAVVLRYYCGLNTIETAAAMGTSTSAVKSLTSKAITALRNDLVLDSQEVTRGN